MTNKTKAALWTSILLITLTFLSVLIVLFTMEFFSLFGLGGICVMAYVIYREILSELNKND